MFRQLLTLGGAEGAAKVLHAIAFLLAARAVGDDALGHLGFAMAFVSYALIAVQPGFDQVATREVARVSSQAVGYLKHILLIRSPAAILAIGATVVYALYGDLRSTTPELLIALSMTCLARALSCRWYYPAVGRFRPLAVAPLLTEGCFLAAALAVRSPRHILTVAGGMVLGEVLGSAYLMTALQIPGRVLARAWDRALVTKLFRESVPITLSLLLGNMLYNFDVLALGLLGRHAEVGIYLVAYRFVTAFQPFIEALKTVIYPRLARSYPRFASIRSRFVGAAVLTFGLFGIVSAFISVLAEWILARLFGPSFVPGAPILRLLIWVLPVVALRTFPRQLLLAYHLQAYEFRCMALAVSVNVAGDLILIPRWGALGCAAATVSSELTLLAALSVVGWAKIHRKME